MAVQRLLPRFLVKLVDKRPNCDSAWYMNAWKLLIQFEFCQCMVALADSTLYSFYRGEFQFCSIEAAALCVYTVIPIADCWSCIFFVFLFLLFCGYIVSYPFSDNAAGLFYKMQILQTRWPFCGF